VSFFFLAVIDEECAAVCIIVFWHNIYMVSYG
jgi:hypothetical protein